MTLSADARIAIAVILVIVGLAMVLAWDAMGVVLGHTAVVPTVGLLIQLLGVVYFWRTLEIPRRVRIGYVIGVVLMVMVPSAAEILLGAL